MNTHSSFSTNKIIFLVVFICAALMTSLFVFHMSHKSNPVLSADDGLIFPAARDVKPFELQAANSKPFTQADLQHHWTLMLFGFTHCQKICPTSLGMLNRVYLKLHRTYPNLQVVMVSLDPERDTPEIVDHYAHSFHPDFIGVTGKTPELRKLQSQLGIFSAREPASGTANYHLQHTASILLMNPQGKWAGVFKYGLNPEQFAQALTASMQSLSQQQNG